MCGCVFVSLYVLLCICDCACFVYVYLSVYVLGVYALACICVRVYACLYARLTELKHNRTHSVPVLFLFFNSKLIFLFPYLKEED